MKINIGYLYYDLLNLYGDSGNIKTLLYHLKEQGVDVNIKYMTLNEEKDFSDLDMIYIGSGTENNILLALEDLKKDKDKIKEFLKEDKILLSTGNSLDLFGNYIIGTQKIKALGIQDYVVMGQNRIVKDVDSKDSFNNLEIIGFENHNGHNLSNTSDIINNGSFYATYIIGPILVRNPKLCSYFVHKLIDKKDNKFEYKEEDYELDELAYKKTVGTI